MSIKERLNVEIESKVGYKFAIICIAFGIILVSQSYLFGYEGKFNYTLFWIGILFSTISTFIAILNINSQYKKLIVLFCFGLLLYLPIIFWSTAYFRFQDEILHVNNLELILKNGNLDTNPLLEVTKYYPGLELLTTFLMKFSGLSLFTMAKIMVGIIHSIMLIFLYLLFKIISSSQKIAIIGAFIYTANSSYIFFDAIFSYETIGIPLMIILIFTIYKNGSSSNDKFNLNLISLIILEALIVTHHFSSYMLSIFLIIFAFCVAYCMYDLKNFGNKIAYMSKFVVITIVLILSWIIYNAQSSVRYFGVMISNSISSILSFIIEDAKIQREPFWQTQLPRYETFVDTYIYIPILFLLYIYGIYLINKNSKNPIYKDAFTDAIYMSLILYGFIFFVSLSLIFTRAGNLFMYRTWAFTFIGLSFVMAVALDKLVNINKYLVCIMVALVIMGGVSIGSGYAEREPNFVLASMPSSITFDMIKSSDWFETYFGKNNVILGDFTIRMVFGGYNNQQVITDPFIFSHNITDIEYTPYLKYNFRHNFIIVDKRITEKLSEYKYYFDRKELKNEDHKYGYTETFPNKNIEKFNNEYIYYKIYDNANINIYYINRDVLSR